MRTVKAIPPSEAKMDAKALAEKFAAGRAVQQLTSPTPLQGANHVFRIWQEHGTVIFKAYGTDSRLRRETHALDALPDIAGMPVVVERGVNESIHWAIFKDGGKWNVQSLPENPGIAEKTGEILAQLHRAEPTAFSNLARGIDQEWIAVDLRSTLRRLERYRGRLGVPAELVSAAQAVPAPYAGNPVVSHTNPVAKKFVVDDAGAVTLITWEWATLAPPEWDLSLTTWSVGLHTGPLAASAVMAGYGRTFEPSQLDRWIVYHAAQSLVHLAERQLSARPADVPANLIPEFNRAVLGAIGE
ncbi:MAG: aminoglycoside phosphotransferase family protein [Acidimicrobiia bacterium]|nr:aminoglycoside phosphotransferase family protein [Acidimicrobiia bacterium]